MTSNQDKKEAKKKASTDTKDDDQKLLRQLEGQKWWLYDKPDGFISHQTVDVVILCIRRRKERLTTHFLASQSVQGHRVQYDSPFVLDLILTQDTPSASFQTALFVAECRTVTASIHTPASFTRHVFPHKLSIHAIRYRVGAPDVVRSWLEGTQMSRLNPYIQFLHNCPDAETWCEHLTVTRVAESPTFLHRLPVQLAVAWIRKHPYVYLGFLTTTPRHPYVYPGLPTTPDQEDWSCPISEPEPYSDFDRCGNQTPLLDPWPTAHHFALGKAIRRRVNCVLGGQLPVADLHNLVVSYLIGFSPVPQGRTNQGKAFTLGLSL